MEILLVVILTVSLILIIATIAALLDASWAAASVFLLLSLFCSYLTYTVYESITSQTPTKVTKYKVESIVTRYEYKYTLPITREEIVSKILIEDKE